MAEPQIPGLRLDYAFSLVMYFDERIEFVGPREGRGYVPPVSGEIVGPMLSGRVVPYSGADYAMWKGDRSGGMKINTHYMLQAENGDWIYINNMGYLHRSPDPENPGETKLYFRFTPYFETPPGENEWMSKHVFVGTGERLSNPDRSRFTYYVVR